MYKLMYIEHKNVFMLKKMYESKIVSLYSKIN